MIRKDCGDGLASQLEVLLESRFGCNFVLVFDVCHFGAQVQIVQSRIQDPVEECSEFEALGAASQDFDERTVAGADDQNMRPVGAVL